jgi:hypothetical protein
MAKAERLYSPMAEASRAALATHGDEDLALLLGFLRQLRDAGVSAVAALRDAGA